MLKSFWRGNIFLSQERGILSHVKWYFQRIPGGFGVFFGGRFLVLYTFVDVEELLARQHFFCLEKEGFLCHRRRVLYENFPKPNMYIHSKRSGLCSFVKNKTGSVAASNTWENILSSRKRSTFPHASRSCWQLRRFAWLRRLCSTRVTIWCRMYHAVV